MITQEYLKTKFEYDPLTGYFTNLKSGIVALSKDAKGYVQFKIDRKTYKAHRLAFLYMIGHIPIEVDHKDNIRDNNKWENLREATRQQQCFNSLMPITNKCGYKGVHFHKAKGHWRATIRINGKKVTIGSFRNPEDAANAYKEAAIKYYGEFAKW